MNNPKFSFKALEAFPVDQDSPNKSLSIVQQPPLEEFQKALASHFKGEDLNSENQDYVFFDLIKEHKSNFIRLTEVKIYFDNDTINIDKRKYQRVFGNAYQS